MTDCSSIQGSTSSSSDAMSSRSDGGGSSCINTSSRIRVIRMIRPNSRRIVLGPENISIGFGFAVRGGKEFGTGFFVSRIEKGGEADSKGLRVGDQIIRVNGYNVEDAVHKELTQFISSQDRLTLKVRGVGMLPIKEKTLDILTWHIVPRHALTTTLAALDEHMTIKDIRIILNVEPKTKLGLGICKGPEWKPGIFVQFTKDFSVARESGLRPGDQILSCNSIDFSDVLFSEAVAVMKSSQTLEMIVRTGAGLDLFPGESSGYNSSASSVTGDQSPCWGDQSAKRLSMVREESISKQWNENCNSTNLDRRKNFHKNLTRPTINNNNLNQCITTTNDLPPNNKTIIQLSETGTLINNTLITNPNNNTKSENLIIRPNQQSHHHPQHLSMNFITPDYNVAALSLNEGGGCAGSNSNNTNDHTNENNIGKMNGKIADICFVSRQSETKTVIVEVHRSAADENKKNNNDGNTNDMNTNAVVNVARRSTNTTNNIPPKPPILPSLSLSSNTSTSSSSPSPSSSLTDGLNDRSPSVASSIISSGGTSLCSAISEELKKRKERLSQCSNQTNNENNNNENETIINAANSRLQPKRGGCVSVLGGNDDFRHNALMDEFKRAHRKMFKNGFQETEEERQEELRKTSMMCDETDHRSTPHQQQTLPLNYNNNNNNNNNDIINKNHNQINHNNNKNHSNGHQNGFTKTELIQNNVMNNNGQFPTPPPPPQFSNNPPMIKISDDDDYTEPIIIPPPPPPETPIPDYDSTPVNSMRKQPQQQNYHANGYVRVATTTTTSANVGTIGRVASTETAKANGDIGELESIDSFKLQNPSSPQPKPPSAYFVAQSSGPPTMKKSIRPVSVTIGEYGGGAVGYRKEPSKFDFIAKSNESSPTSSLPSPTTPTNNSIKDDSGNVSHMLRSELEMTLSRSNLKKRNNEFDRNGGVINHIQNGGVHQNGSNGITQNGGGIQQIQNGGNKIQNGNCNYQKYQNDIGQNGGSKSVLHKTQSSNIEKLTNMLQNKQHIFEQNNNDRSATLTNSNRVTINIPNNKTTITTSTGKIELRKTESTPTNGILKNGLNRTSYIDKSISFGN